MILEGLGRLCCCQGGYADNEVLNVYACRRLDCSRKHTVPASRQ